MSSEEITRRPKFCPVCTKRYFSKVALDKHTSTKHKGYIPKAVRGRAFRKMQDAWSVVLLSGRFESNRRKF
jgi:hypothetical protein